MKRRSVWPVVVFLCATAACSQSDKTQIPSKDFFGGEESSSPADTLRVTPFEERMRGLAPSAVPLSLILSAILISWGLMRIASELRRRNDATQAVENESQVSRQFADAVNRFGSSQPSVRGSAALDLARLACQDDRQLVPALRQIGSMLIFETDEDVLTTDSHAIQEIISANPALGIKEMYALNLRLKERLLARVARRAAAMGARTVSGLERFDTFWQAVSAVAGYSPSTLRFLLREPNTDTLLLKDAHNLAQRKTSKRKNAGEEATEIEEIGHAAVVLRYQAELLATALAQHSGVGLCLAHVWLPDTALTQGNTDLSGADFRDAYLQNSDLRGTVLRNADLSGASLQGALLSGADLSGAQFEGAYLYGTSLAGAKLDGAKLAGFIAQPYFDKEPTPPSFDAANWWDAESTGSWGDWLRRNYPPPGGGPPSPTHSAQDSVG